MDPAIAEVVAVVAAQGATVAGPLFTRHFTVSPDVFDFEVGFPVTAPVRPEGRVAAGELPAARVARAVYRGPYEKLGDAWRELGAWISEQGYRQGPHLWERYIAGPESSPDPTQWRTELNRPVRGADGGPPSS